MESFRAVHLMRKGRFSHWTLDCLRIVPGSVCYSFSQEYLPVPVLVFASKRPLFFFDTFAIAAGTSRPPSKSFDGVGTKWRAGYARLKFELRHNCKRFISVIVKEMDVYLLKSFAARVVVNEMAVVIARTAPINTVGVAIGTVCSALRVQLLVGPSSQLSVHTHIVLGPHI